MVASIAGSGVRLKFQSASRCLCALVMCLAGMTIVGCAQAGTDVSHEEQLAAAQKLFEYAPGAKWRRIEQPFWNDHVIFKLAEGSSRQWPFRPSVAVDRSRNAYLLSDGVIRVPGEKILQDFNLIASRERLRVNAQNAQAYARFFVSVHLIANDCLHLVDEQWGKRIVRTRKGSAEHMALRGELQRAGELAINLVAVQQQFDAVALLWNVCGSWVSEHRFSIHDDGTVVFKGTKWHEQPASAEAGSER